MLAAVNRSLPTDGTKVKLVERFVCAKELKCGLEAGDGDESEEEGEGEEEEEEEPEPTVAIACAGIKNLEKLQKKLQKTLRNARNAAPATSRESRTDSRVATAAVQVVQMVCMSCRVAICTQLSCLSKHANTGKGNVWPKSYMPRLSKNQGGQSNPKKGEHYYLRKDAEGLDGEEGEEE